MINRRTLLASIGLALPAVVATAATAAAATTSSTAKPKKHVVHPTHHVTKTAAHKPAASKLHHPKPKTPTPG
jgi:hypothetical protein